ncbi:MAG: hypothetical protein ACTSYU_10965 [Promethearchaeota archaeon]
MPDKTRMKSKVSKKEWTGVTKHRPLSLVEIKDFSRKNFAERVKPHKDKREEYQRLRTFFINK